MDFLLYSFPHFTCAVHFFPAIDCLVRSTCDIVIYPAPVVPLPHSPYPQPTLRATPTHVTPPPPCRQWRQEQEERLAKKDAAEQEAIEEQRQQAQQELEEMYRRMDEQLEQTKARNRSVRACMHVCACDGPV